MKRTLFFAPAAVLALRTFDRQIVRQIWAAIEALRDNPDILTVTTDTFDPSVFGLTLLGDVTIWFEILDERHAIRVLAIEE